MPPKDGHKGKTVVAFRLNNKWWCCYWFVLKIFEALSFCESACQHVPCGQVIIPFRDRESHLILFKWPDGLSGILLFFIVILHGFWRLQWFKKREFWRFALLGNTGDGSQSMVEAQKQCKTGWSTWQSNLTPRLLIVDGISTGPWPWLQGLQQHLQISKLTWALTLTARSFRKLGESDAWVRFWTAGNTSYCQGRINKPP